MSDETENATKDDEFPAWQQEQQRRAGEKWNSGAMDGGPATTPTAALVEEAETVADGMSARIRDLVWIVENYDPEEEREDDRCPECKTPLGAPEEPGMEPTPFCNCCAHAVVEELALAVQQLRQAVRRAEAERDVQHALVLRLTGELEALATKTGDVEWREDAAVKVVKMRGRQIAELTATRDLLTAENARLQKELATLRYLHNGGH